MTQGPTRTALAAQQYALFSLAYTCHVLFLDVIASTLRMTMVYEHVIRFARVELDV